MNVGYYPEFELPSFFKETGFANDLKKIFDQKYEGLDKSGTKDFEEVVSFVCQKMMNNYGHHSLIKMTKFICLSVQSNILWYDEKDQISNKIINALEFYHEPRPVSSYSYSEKKMTGSQAWDEARVVFDLAVDCLDPDLCVASLCEIMELCLDGYAIGPVESIEMQRDVFNWWLCDLIPCSIYSKEPQMMFYLQTKWPAPAHWKKL